jgi:predicted metal-dependent HD superfamily phosphohydrolase
MKTDYLKVIFYKRVSHYTEGGGTFINQTFDELLHAYNSNKRHYHDLNHVIHLLHLLENYKFQINDYDSLFLAIWFHDAIYAAGRNDNEQKSADWAKTFLSKTKMPTEQITKIHRYILATQNHETTGENDLNYFLDFDLSILGAEEAIYDIYARQIKEEYSFFGSFLYNIGRKKALKQLLSQPLLYKTAYFRDKYEIQARENIEREISML